MRVKDGWMASGGDTFPTPAADAFEVRVPASSSGSGTGLSEELAQREFLERIRKYRDAYMNAADAHYPMADRNRFAEQRDEHWKWISDRLARSSVDRLTTSTEEPDR